MITIRQLRLQRGQKILFQAADASILPGRKVGVIGKNGCGKSSLFSLLSGELLPDGGEVTLPPRWRIAQVAQETPALDTPALEYVLDGDHEFRRLEKALQTAEGEQAAELHAQLEHVGGYDIRARAARLLAGLGFSQTAQQQSVAEFSGGWRMRLNLAQALIIKADLLLLDEPTNHLDLETVLWLEQHLQQYEGTLLVISHDRDFLDAVANTILQVEQQTLTLYSGNYTAFERQRAQKLAQQQALFERQQRQVAHLQHFIDRFRAKATKAKQAQSRIKALERLELVAAVQADTPFSFTFLTPHQQPNPLLRFENVDLGYTANTPLLQDIHLTLLAGSRWGLLGLNGAGKSTLIKALAGELTLMQGERTDGKGLQVGYFAQHQLEQLRDDDSPLAHLQRLDPQTREQELRDFLGGFNFRGEMATSAIAPFSGGEKARLALALLIWQRPNLLLLDEPTNHLDLDTRDALTLALQDYVGALVVVSHDRHLLQAVCDDFYLVEHGKVAPFAGDLDDYRRYRLNSTSASHTPTRPGENKDRKTQKRQEAEARQRLASQRKPLQQALLQVERELSTAQQQLDERTTYLANPESYLDGEKEKLKQALREQAQFEEQVSLLELRWLELQTSLDDLVDE